MSTNNSWLRVLGIVVLSLLILGAVAFAAYRVGLNQGAGLLTQGPRMHMYDGRGFYPMMRFGWHLFHPGFWLGLAAILLIVFLLVKAFGNQPAPSNQSSSHRSSRR